MAKPGRKPHEPTPKTRSQVETMAGLGLPQPMIALLVTDLVKPATGCTEKTLRKHYRTELDLGEAKATLKVCETLWNRATVGKDLGAAIFWLKARAGWREVQKHEHDVTKGGTLEEIVAKSMAEKGA